MTSQTPADFIEQCRAGRITLVLGSGVSAGGGLPSWNTLAEHVWQAAFPKRRSPWDTNLAANSPRNVPQFLPIVFELARKALGQERFVAELRAKLYENARLPMFQRGFKTSSGTLAVLGRVLVQEYRRRGRRRIDAVVTLNIDDLLEQAVSVFYAGVSKKWVGTVVRSYARATGRYLSPPDGPIPVYHLHGFVPSNVKGAYGRGPWRFPRFFDQNLVFTDLQYWSTTASPLTFTNRVMSWMLGETRCLFIGLSMTDINLLRWLALRTLELDRDAEEVRQARTTRMAKDMGLGFARHYWIRPTNDDPTGFLTEFLNLRGTLAVDIHDWCGPSFARLMMRCFPNR